MVRTVETSSGGSGPGPEQDRDRELDDLLDVIGRQARASNRARAAVIAEVLADLPGASGDRVDQAVRSAHQLAGSAGTFGMSDVSSLARRLEGFLAANPAVDDAGLRAARADLADLQDRLHLDGDH